MAALGFVAAIIVMRLKQGHAEMSSNQVSAIALYGMISAIFGARLFYVVQFWGQSKDNVLEILKIDHGGLVFYGGFICCNLVVIIYCRAKKLSILRVLDVLAVALPLGHAFGRIGCFLNGCCYGKPCLLPWGVVFPEGSDPTLRYPGISLHPVQLYESCGNLALFAILFYSIRKSKPGQTTALYLFLYGLMRFLDEFLRGDHTDFVFGIFTPAQTIGLFLIPLGLALFIHLQKKVVKLKN